MVASGLLSAWLQLRSVPALWQTGYGRLLAAKVPTVAAMVGLGWANRRRLGRRPDNDNNPTTTTTDRERPRHVGSARGSVAWSRSRWCSPPSSWP